jgi:hypothetical protein
LKDKVFELFMSDCEKKLSRRARREEDIYRISTMVKMSAS